LLIDSVIFLMRREGSIYSLCFYSASHRSINYILTAFLNPEAQKYFFQNPLLEGVG